MKKFLALAGVFGLAACTSSILTDSPKVTATQEIIVSSSEHKAVDSLPPLPALMTDGTAYVDSAGQGIPSYELSVFRTWLLQRGVKLTDNRAKAAIIITPYIAVDSYNIKSLLIGLPALSITGYFKTPELALYGQTTEIAINQIGFYSVYSQSGALAVAEVSRYGLQPYSVTKSAFFFSAEHPKIAPDDRAN